MHILAPYLDSDTPKEDFSHPRATWKGSQPLTAVSVQTDCRYRHTTLGTLPSTLTSYFISSLDVATAVQFVVSSFRPVARDINL